MIKKIDKSLLIFKNPNMIFDNPFLENYAYFENDIIVAYISISVLYDRIEIDYIWVDESYRRNGIASKLLEYIINRFDNIVNITLEVNVNNFAAINLYKKFGFNESAIRKKYYGSDDAILMMKEME